jgi:hypothetical protein
MSASPSLGAVAELVPFLRSRRGVPEPDGDEVRAIDLLNDPDGFAQRVLDTAQGRGTSDPQVLASLWWQSYAYRAAGTTLAAWVVAGSAPDPTIESGIGVGMSRARPASLLVGPDATEISHLPDLVTATVGGHLTPLADALRSRIQVGQRLLDGNAVASIAGCLGAVVCADDAPPELGARMDEVFAALPATYRSLGSWEVPHRAFRRRTCCLWWKTEGSGGALCEDCSLTRAPDEAVGGR